MHIETMNKLFLEKIKLKIKFNIKRIIMYQMDFLIYIKIFLKIIMILKHHILINIKIKNIKSTKIIKNVIKVIRKNINNK